MREVSEGLGSAYWQIAGIQGWWPFGEDFAASSIWPCRQKTLKSRIIEYLDMNLLMDRFS